LAELQNIKPGTKIGRYHVLSRLASGGMAEVWLGEYRGPGGFSKRVVLKTMLPQLTQSEHLVKMFITEAAIAAKLEHDNIVRIFDFGENEGYYFIAMEYVAGRTLRQVGRRYRKLSQPIDTWLLARVAIDTCSALKYVHDFDDGTGRSLGLVHRDVSPENMMVSFTGTVKLLDFGVVAATEGAASSMEMLVGKCRYMAPERIGTPAAFPPSDIFSLGVILYEYSTGVAPFEGDNEAAVLRKILETTPQRPRELVPSLPQEFDNVVMRSLARDPVDRYNSADTFAADLRRVLMQTDPEGMHRPLDKHMAMLFADATEIPSYVRLATKAGEDAPLDVDVELLGDADPAKVGATDVSMQAVPTLNPALAIEAPFSGSSVPRSGVPSISSGSKSGVPSIGSPSSSVPSVGTSSSSVPSVGTSSPNLPPSGIPKSGVSSVGIPSVGIPKSGVPSVGATAPAVPPSGIPKSGVPSVGIPKSSVPSVGIPKSGAQQSGTTIMSPPPEPPAATASAGLPKGAPAGVKAAPIEPASSEDTKSSTSAGLFDGATSKKPKEPSGDLFAKPALPSNEASTASSEGAFGARPSAAALFRDEANPAAPAPVESGGLFGGSRSSADAADSPSSSSPFGGGGRPSAPSAGEGGGFFGGSPRPSAPSKEDAAKSTFFGGRPSAPTRDGGAESSGALFAGATRGDSSSLDAMFSSGNRSTAADQSNNISSAAPGPSPAELKKAAKLFERGLEHFSNKSFHAALEAWREAVSLDPQNRAYQTNLRRLEQQLGKVDNK
jgi:serine/threonine-protein kinase